jgi:hypothetical protein
VQALPDIPSVAHVIQLAVAPVFLLTGIGAILSVLVNRLGRVVDRFRTLDLRLPEMQATALTSAEAEMALLSQRARMIHWAIGLCTGCALLICLVIATLFVGSLVSVEMSAPVAALFVSAMLALIAGLLCFLREIALAKSSIHRWPR